MVGVNVGVPAPIALFSFSGWRGLPPENEDVIRVVLPV